MLRALSLLRQSKPEGTDPGQPEVDSTASTADGSDYGKKIESRESTTTNGESTSSAVEKAEAVDEEEKRRNDSLEEIYAWIDQIPLSRPRRNIARDFSDAVLMAELLKQYYPRFVDLHNYMSKNSIAHKIDNWSTLNRKVLWKIDLKLGKATMFRLANSQPGAIESVLINLRTRILKDCNAERNALYFDYEENGKGETVKSVLNPEEVGNKTVPREAFVKLKRELSEKKKVMSALNEKISHLENLIKLKDQRIADLTVQITGHVAVESNITDGGTEQNSAT